MNECIAKLANQSGFDVDSTGKFGNYSEMHRLEKFAELIVKECCEVTHCNFHVDGLTLGGILKEHFGVEE